MVPIHSLFQGRVLFTLPPFKFRALVLSGNRILLRMIGRSEMNSYAIHWAQYVNRRIYHVYHVDSLL